MSFFNPVAFLLRFVSKLLIRTGKLISNVGIGIRILTMIKGRIRLRSEDIVIVSYPRSGTTWLQMILYQLCTDGNMEFDHISQKCPWFERSVLPNSMSAKSLQHPGRRIIKTHLPYKTSFVGGAKFIYIWRDGTDVINSYFHFYQSYLKFKGNFDLFYKRFTSGKVQFGSWFDHVRAWKTNSKNRNVLILKYEDLVSDLEANVRRIAAFCELRLEEEHLKRVLERSSFDYMRTFERKFDHLTEIVLDMGLPLKERSFVRKGKIGGGDTLLNEQQRSKYLLKAQAAGLV